MFTFSELLQAAGALPRIDTVVHLGAGPFFDDELYRRLGAQRHVLVEADPEAAGHLRRSIPDSGFEVRECMVASASGNVLFHRFSLPALNGPFAVGEISRIYPRLRELESLPMASTATESFFASIALPPDATSALLFDIPGQEANILRALPSRILQQFEVIAVRGAGDPRMQGAALHADAHTVLAGAGFLQASGGTKSDPLFPLALFRLDRGALELQVIREERDTLQAKLAALQSEHSKLSTRHSSLATALEELQGKHSSLVTAEKDLSAARDNLAKERDQARAERDNAAKERDALQAKLAALQSEHSDLVTRQSSLATALEELQGKHSSLLATEKDVAAARDNLTKERDQARAERDNAAKERDTLKKTASDRAMRIAELEAQVADQAERQRQIDEEIAKAEGQLEMLASLFESGASRPR
jgi:predicted  nucleic acid-binding Zn-ribbon protein